MKKREKNAASVTNICSLLPNWWVFALRGLFAIIFGIFALYMPGSAFLAMTLLFGAYAIADGIFYIIAGINEAPRGRKWGWLVLSGLISIIAGLGVLIWPQIASVGLSAFLWGTMSMWAIATGFLQIAAAIRLRREIEDEWLLALSGILSVILGTVLLILFLIDPLASLVIMGLLMGINSLAYGIIQFLLALKLFKRERIAFIAIETSETANIL